MNEVELGRSIQNARKAAGFTQQELCQKTGISYSTLAKIERGAIKSPSVFTVAQIARVTGCSMEDLVGAVKSPDSPEKAFQTARNGIRFVYFDINGCMVRFFQRAFTLIAADTGANPEAVEGTFWHYNDAVCRGEMSVEDFNAAMAEKLQVDTVDWPEYYLKSVEMIDEAQAVLRWASEHFRVGLLSNIMPGQIQTMMDRGILPQIEYQAVVDSSQVGAIKPEARIYEVATEKAGVDAKDILLVDDSRSNLMAAQHMGWHVLWFDDFRPEESVARIKQALEL